jgi:hypothetical protein
MECKKESNAKHCNCTYEPCSRKHNCCDCVHYHRQNDVLPACFFTEEQERTYNRSVDYFIKSR